MNDIPNIISCLKESPKILANLIKSISDTDLSKKSTVSRWTIHEHCCHLADVQPMLIDRLKIFRDESNPSFTPFLPGKTVSDSHLQKMSVEQAISDFGTYRTDMVQLAEELGADVWTKAANHPEYKMYNAYILLRHILMHDHFHMYRIESLWLTNT